MKYTKTMYPGCLYLFEGQASSSSCFIQSKEDAKSFITLANLLLRDYMKIHEYNLTKDSWFMLISLRSRGKIIKSYKKSREKSTTCDRSKDYKKIWKIISEQMRKFLKQYVTEANRRSGREGSLVKAPYKKSYFENKEEANQHIVALRKQLIKREQKLKRYRGRKKFFKIARNKVKGYIYLCSDWKNSKLRIDEFFRKFKVDMSNFIDFKSFMPLNLINKTLQAHKKP